jgi:hypothetical protein
VVRGAGGNLSTEDFANMVHEMGIATGVDLAGIVAAARIAQQALERSLGSYVYYVGTPQQFYARVREEQAVAGRVEGSSLN